MQSECNPSAIGVQSECNLSAVCSASQELREVRLSRREGRFREYLMDGWNSLDWAVAGLGAGSIVFRVYVYLHTTELFGFLEARAREEEYVDVMPLMWELQQVHRGPLMIALDER